jgi:hypothetical protein
MPKSVAVSGFFHLFSIGVGWVRRRLAGEIAYRKSSKWFWKRPSKPIGARVLEEL